MDIHRKGDKGTDYFSKVKEEFKRQAETLSVLK